jgi:hypothetical protein
MLDIGKSGNALSCYPEVHPKLRRGNIGGLPAAFAPSCASIYRRCVGHDGAIIRPVRNGTKVFSGLNILDGCRRAAPVKYHDARRTYSVSPARLCHYATVAHGCFDFGAKCNRIRILPTAIGLGSTQDMAS